MTCGHCVASVTEEVSQVAGVDGRRRRPRQRRPHRHQRRHRSTGGRPRRRRGGRLRRWREQHARPVIAAFVVGLAVVFAGRLGVGSAVGPDVGPSRRGRARRRRRARRRHGRAGATSAGHGGLHGPETATRSSSTATASPAGPAGPVTFRMLDADGAAVTAYDVKHERGPAPDRGRAATSPASSTCTRRSPTDGTWTTSLDADARHAGGCSPTSSRRRRRGPHARRRPGRARAPYRRPAPVPAPRDHRGRRLHRTLTATWTPATRRELTLRVSRDGRPVTDLQPYLGAYGHLVVLRDGDLAYLHVHPAGEPGDGTTEPGVRTSRSRRRRPARHLPAVPRLQARRRRPHRRVHRRASTATGSAP